MFGIRRGSPGPLVFFSIHQESRLQSSEGMPYSLRHFNQGRVRGLGSIGYIVQGLCFVQGHSGPLPFGAFLGYRFGVRINPGVNGAGIRA